MALSPHWTIDLAANRRINGKNYIFLILIYLNLFDDFSLIVSGFIYTYFACMHTQKFPEYTETEIAKKSTK